jgi:hypothetical protein
MFRFIVDYSGLMDFGLYVISIFFIWRFFERWYFGLCWKLITWIPLHNAYHCTIIIHKMFYFTDLLITRVPLHNVCHLNVIIHKYYKYYIKTILWNWSPWVPLQHVNYHFPLWYYKYLGIIYVGKNPWGRPLFLNLQNFFKYIINLKMVDQFYNYLYNVCYWS